MYSIRIEGDTRRLIRRMRGLSEVDVRGVNRTLAEAVRTSTRERFKEERSPEGRRWEKSIRASKEGGVTLTKSAAMKNSIKSTADNSGFAVGTNKIYAKTHQFGEDGRKITIKAKTSKGLVFKIGDRWIRKKQVTIKVNIPARPFLGLSEEDLLEIKSTLEDVFEEE
ncbi:phage virion morphogenesis protein [Tissierella carlieri]|uniref:Phage virion morphogenesis protein n=2 Tax=Tissierella carlieri TaxID=689904 RepID=A0ABT1SCC8_9FIRM|nr:phage virion morphogenesis protein [Tissierella carlieri]